MIFISDNGINILREATQWSLDGTFLLAPPPFMQLYIVSGLVGHNNLPAAYVYLPNKDADTYRIMMELIIGLVQKTPDTCTLDFEAAMIGTIQNLEVEINLCYFHLKQSLLRQMKVRRIFQTFNKSSSFQEAVRDFLSLAFLKPDDAVDATQSYVLPQFQFVVQGAEIEDVERAKVDTFFNYIHVSMIYLKTL